MMCRLSLLAHDRTPTLTTSPSCNRQRNAHSGRLAHSAPPLGTPGGCPSRGVASEPPEATRAPPLPCGGIKPRGGRSSRHLERSRRSAGDGGFAIGNRLEIPVHHKLLLLAAGAAAHAAGEAPDACHVAAAELAAHVPCRAARIAAVDLACSHRGSNSGHVHMRQVHMRQVHMRQVHMRQVHKASPHEASPQEASPQEASRRTAAPEQQMR